MERDWLAAREDGMSMAAWLQWLARCDTRSFGDPLRWLAGKVPHAGARGARPRRVGMRRG